MNIHNGDACAGASKIASIPCSREPTNSGIAVAVDVGRVVDDDCRLTWPFLADAASDDVVRLIFVRDDDQGDMLLCNGGGEIRLVPIHRLNVDSRAAFHVWSLGGCSDREREQEITKPTIHGKPLL